MTQTEQAKRPSARAVPGFPRLQVLHNVQLEHPYWYAYRVIVGPLGIVCTDKSRPASTVEAAAEWARGDACRIAANMARIRSTVERHAEECDRDAAVILSDAEGYRREANRHRAEAIRLAEAAEASKARASTLLSAIEAAKYRILGGKRVEVAGLQPREMVRAESLPSRESEEQRTETLLAKAVEENEKAAEHDRDAERIVEQAARKRTRASELRLQARQDGDAFILSQRGRDFTW